MPAATQDGQAARGDRPRESLTLDDEQRRELAWAIVESDMLAHLVSRRLSDRLDGIEHGTEGSIDKVLMTWVEQAVGHAAVAVAGAALRRAATRRCSARTSTAGRRA